VLDYDYRSPLHIACQEGMYKVAEYLVQTIKIDYNVLDRWSNTPLDYAYISGNKQIV